MKDKAFLLILFICLIGYYGYHKLTHPKGNYPPEPENIPITTFKANDIKVRVDNMEFILSDSTGNKALENIYATGGFTDSLYIKINNTIEALNQYEETLEGEDKHEVYYFANKEYSAEIQIYNNPKKTVLYIASKTKNAKIVKTFNYKI